MMRAWHLTEYGQPPVPVTIDEPEVGPGSDLVEVTAVSITPLDLLIASGRPYFGPPDLPYVPGVQGVGRVGERRVWFTTDAGIQAVQGSLAERIAVPRERQWVIPGDVPDAVVAGLGLSAVAAHGVLRRGRFAAGDSVLVLGAAGVVGRVAVQLAKAWGAGFVAAACRGIERADMVRDLGADVVVDIGGMDAEGMSAAFREAVPDGVDLVVDPVWGPPTEAAATALRPAGRLVNLGDSAGPVASFSSAGVRSRSAEILGYTNLSLSWTEQTTAMAQILDLVAAGSVRFEPDLVGPDEVGAGWQRQAEGQASSRVVVRIGS